MEGLNLESGALIDHRFTLLLSLERPQRMRSAHHILSISQILDLLHQIRIDVLILCWRQNIDFLALNGLVVTQLANLSPGSCTAMNLLLDFDVQVLDLLVFGRLVNRISECRVLQMSVAVVNSLFQLSDFRPKVSRSSNYEVWIH